MEGKRFNPLIGGADRATWCEVYGVHSDLADRFNPLIGGADRATACCSPLPTLFSSSFNPLIGGADRATTQSALRAPIAFTSFQSPHRRGGSRDEVAERSDAHAKEMFQSPHRRGGSRDVGQWSAGGSGVNHSFNPLIGGADRATSWIEKSFDPRIILFQSPHRRGGSRDVHEGPFTLPYGVVSIPS